MGSIMKNGNFYGGNVVYTPQKIVELANMVNELKNKVENSSGESSSISGGGPDILSNIKAIHEGVNIDELTTAGTYQYVDNGDINVENAPYDYYDICEGIAKQFTVVTIEGYESNENDRYGYQFFIFSASNSKIYFRPFPAENGEWRQLTNEKVWSRWADSYSEEDTIDLNSEYTPGNYVSALGKTYNNLPNFGIDDTPEFTLVVEEYPNPDNVNPDYMQTLTATYFLELHIFKRILRVSSGRKGKTVSAVCDWTEITPVHQE